MRKRAEEIALVIHGHFYQPPRENPWLLAIEAQEGARPYHDWNERILAECYRPNARSRILDGFGRVRKVVSNFESISFNFGPTILTYLEREDPDTYRRILDADRRSVDRRSGHGNAIAQAYHHAILPLLSREDRELLIRWGLDDFERRFGRKSEGLWLPETAVHAETAADVARAGVRFVILSPHQASKTRPLAGGEWADVSGGSIDPRRAYRLFPDPNDRALHLDVLFYDSGLAVGISFEHYLWSADDLARRFFEAAGEPIGAPRLVCAATDGEVYGHHEPFGDMCLAALFDSAAERNGLRATNPGEFLHRVPPDQEVLLAPGPEGEGTAWSCTHGVGRWSRDCGCRIAHREGWNQTWRGPLRESMIHLRNDLFALFEEEASRLFLDPRRALETYAEVLGERTPESWRRFLEREGSDRALESRDGPLRAHRVLETAHGAVRMFTSCAWFFDDLAGIEAVQNLLFAGHAIDSARAIDPERAASAERDFRRRLRAARSNVPEEGDGQSIYDDRVEGARVSSRAWAGAWAAARLVGAPFTERLLAGREANLFEEKRRREEEFEILSGLLRLSDPLRIREEAFRFVAARDARSGLLVWVGGEDLPVDAVDRGSAMEDLVRALPSTPLRLEDLPSELRAGTAGKLLEEERDAILEASEPLDGRLFSAIALLERTHLPAPGWVRRLLLPAIERRLQTAVREIAASLEDGGALDPVFERLAAARAHADLLGVGLEGICGGDELRAVLLHALRRRREEDPEKGAVCVLSVLEGLDESGFPLRDAGFLQDEFLDQQHEGVPMGSKGRRLGERLGFAPELLGR
jgi:hypothetical protein